MKHRRQTTPKQAAWRAWGIWILILLSCLFLHVSADRQDDRRSALLVIVSMLLTTWALLFRRARDIIPALNYHSVSMHPGWLGLPELSISPFVLEAHLRHFMRSGYQTIFISELHTMLNGPVPPPQRCVALTFDDGYADNWIAVLPLLEKYGMKATIFVSADFIDPRPIKRPGMYQNPAPEDWAGYLTFDELAAMRDSGLIEIQPHGKTHDRSFTDDTIRGFVSPTTPNIWLYWRTHPEHKTDWWLQPDLTESLSGYPLFTDGPALAQRAYLPDPAACRHMMDFTRRQGHDFFLQPDWSEQLWKEWHAIRQRTPDGARMETEAEFAERVTADLKSVRQLLRERLSVPADVLCWPQNVFCAMGENLARDAGFKATVSNYHQTRNRVSQNASRILRFNIADATYGSRATKRKLIDFIIRCWFMEGMYGLLPLVLLINRREKITINRKRALRCQSQPSIWY